jgi:hypothetical protein
MKRKWWTTTEVKILAEYWPKGGVKACASQLPARDSRSIASKAQKLGMFIDGYRHPEPVNWTPFLDRQVRLAYADPSTGAIKSAARRLGISYGAFKMRARTLGCVYRYYNRPWEAAEDEMVQQNADKGLRWIQIKLKASGFQRSMAAISSRRNKLGCSGDSDPDRMNAAQLSRLCGIDNKVVLRWIEEGWLKAKRGQSLFTPNPKEDYFWIIRAADFRAFVRNYQSAIDLRKVDQPWFMEVLLGPPLLELARAGHK